MSPAGKDLFAGILDWGILFFLIFTQEDRGSIPGLATWIFRDWLSPASKSRYGWKITKSTLILKNNQPTNQPNIYTTYFRGAMSPAGEDFLAGILGWDTYFP